ncbi:hypothetical protein BJ742DRAFT_780971 [Cladochytrium replicatum]|nr:hypothetical protein BJ742DRAFT_780971 [Cladochytrium replicatum]
MADHPQSFSAPASSHLAAEVDRHLSEINELLQSSTAIRSQNVPSQPSRSTRTTPLPSPNSAGSVGLQASDGYFTRPEIPPRSPSRAASPRSPGFGDAPPYSLAVLAQPDSPPPTPLSPLESSVIQSRLNNLRQMPLSPQVGTRRLQEPDDDKPPPFNEHDHSMSGRAGFGDVKDINAFLDTYSGEPRLPGLQSPTLSPSIIEAPIRSTSLGRITASSKAANLPPPLPPIAEPHLPPYTPNRSDFLESIGQAVMPYEESVDSNQQNANFGDGSSKMRVEQTQWIDSPMRIVEPTAVPERPTGQNDQVPVPAGAIPSPMAALTATFEKQVTAYQGAVATAAANVPDTLALLPPSPIKKSGFDIGIQIAPGSNTILHGFNGLSGFCHLRALVSISADLPFNLEHASIVFKVVSTITTSGTPGNAATVFEKRLNIFGETDPNQAGSATRRFGGSVGPAKFPFDFELPTSPPLIHTFSTGRYHQSDEVVHDVSVVHLLEVRALARPSISGNQSGSETIPLRFTFELENFPLFTHVSVYKVMDQHVQVWAPETGDVQAEVALEPLALGPTDTLFLSFVVQTNRRIEYIMFTIVERWTMDVGGNIFGHERKVLEKKWPEKIEGEFSVPRRIKVTIPQLPRSGEQHWINADVLSDDPGIARGLVHSCTHEAVIAIALEKQPISKKLAGGMNKVRQQWTASSSRRGASPNGSPRLQLLHKAAAVPPHEEVDDYSFLMHEIGDHNPLDGHLPPMNSAFPPSRFRQDHSASSSSSGRMGRSPSDPGSQNTQVSLGMNASQQSAPIRNLITQWSKASNDRYELRYPIFIASHSVEQARALVQFRPDILQQRRRGVAALI